MEETTVATPVSLVAPAPTRQAPVESEETKATADAAKPTMSEHKRDRETEEAKDDRGTTLNSAATNNGEPAKKKKKRKKKDGPKKPKKPKLKKGTNATTAVTETAAAVMAPMETTREQSTELFGAIVARDRLKELFTKLPGKAKFLRSLLLWMITGWRHPRGLVYPTPTPPRFNRILVIGVGSFPTAVAVESLGGKAMPWPEELLKSSVPMSAPGDKKRIFRAVEVLLHGKSGPGSETSAHGYGVAYDGKQCSIESLVLTETRLAEMEFDHAGTNGVVETVPLKDGESLPESRKVLSLDCEMCNTTEGLELARVSIVDSELSPVYDAMVRPTHQITDYITAISGITKEMLEMPGVKSLDEARKDVLGIVRAETILVGHSLWNDLSALKLFHRRIVDTVELYPHPNGGQYKNKLSTLVKLYLGRNLHPAGAPHDSLGDARATLELVRLRTERGAPVDRASSPNNPASNFFGLVARANCSATCVDEASFVGKMVGNCDGNNGVLGVAVRDDREATEAAKVAIAKDNSVVWVQLHDLNRPLHDVMMAKHAHGALKRDDDAYAAAMKAYADALVVVGSHVTSLCESVPAGTLVLLYGLQGSNQLLYGFKQTSRNNGDGLWGEEHEAALRQEVEEQKLTQLFAMVK